MHHLLLDLLLLEDYESLGSRLLSSWMSEYFVVRIVDEENELLFFHLSSVHLGSVLEVEDGAARLFCRHSLLETVEGIVTRSTDVYLDELGVFLIKLHDDVSPAAHAPHVVELVAYNHGNVQVTHAVHVLTVRLVVSSHLVSAVFGSDHGQSLHELVCQRLELPRVTGQLLVQFFIINLFEIFLRLILLKFLITVAQEKGHCQKCVAEFRILHLRLRGYL